MKEDGRRKRERENEKVREKKTYVVLSFMESSTRKSNIIYEIQLTKRNTLLYKKIYLSHIILERGTQFIVSVRDRWRDIYSERGLIYAPYLLPGARGCRHLHPFASRIVRDDTNASDRLHIPGSTLDSDWPDCLNLTAWFSYHVVSFGLHTCSTG